jgi:hypothetical protein
MRQFRSLRRAPCSYYEIEKWLRRFLLICLHVAILELFLQRRFEWFFFLLALLYYR